MKATLGVIGGMGSHATARFFSKIVELSPATLDQEHIEIHLHNNTKIPDRTAGILKQGPDPLPELLRSVGILDSLGVDYIAIPCMTSHHFIDRLQQNTSAVILNAIEGICRKIDSDFPEMNNIGVMATLGSINIGLFQNEIKKFGKKPVLLSEKDLNEFVMKAIYMEKGIKAGYANGLPHDLLLKAAQKIVSKGAEAIIMGCTEIPLALKDGDIEVPLIDTIESLAILSIQSCLH